MVPEVKNPPVVQTYKRQGLIPGSENPLEEEVVTHSSILASENPLVKNLAGCSPELQRVRHDRAQLCRQLDKLKIPNTYFINPKTGIASSPHYPPPYALSRHFWRDVLKSLPPGALLRNLQLREKEYGNLYNTRDQNSVPCGDLDGWDGWREGDPRGRGYMYAYGDSLPSTAETNIIA